MRAAYITELGPAEAIRAGELPVPAAGPTDVLVRVEVVVVDPVDTMVRSGAYRTPTPFPFVVGRDLVGTVAEAGAGWPGSSPETGCGATAWGTAGGRGPLPSTRWCRPSGCTTCRRGWTRWRRWRCCTRRPPRTWPCSATAACGPPRSCMWPGPPATSGTMMTSLARVGGARVLAGARPEGAGWCRAAGAAEVVDYRDPDLAGRLAALAPAGIDVYADTSGHLDLPAAVDLLADGGRIVLMAGSDQRLTLPAGPLYTHDRDILGFVISLASTADLAEAAAVLNDRLAAGDLPVRVREVWPLERAAEAHRAVERGERGRTVLRVAPAEPS
jgi:NADPH:quinone reductase-like Zn-dependent oxidoreductase